MINFDNLKKGDLVLVTWQDCASNGSDWNDNEDMDKWLKTPRPIKAVGWVYDHNDTHLICYSSTDYGRSKEPLYRMIWELYKPQIIDIQRLMEVGFKNAEEISTNPFSGNPKREHHENCKCLKCKKKKGKL